MYFIIQANGINKHINTSDLNKLAMARIKMAMAEEGDATIKAYITDFADYLAELSEESGNTVSNEPKEWIDYIADHLVSCNTTWFVAVNGNTLQLNPKDRDKISKSIYQILEKEVS